MDQTTGTHLKVTPNNSPALLKFNFLENHRNVVVVSCRFMVSVLGKDNYTQSAICFRTDAVVYTSWTWA